MHESPETTARRIAERFFKREPQKLRAVVGKGFVNEVWIAEADSERIVIRMNDADSRAEAIYVKEKWCMEQAAEAGIPGAKVLELGTCGGTPYMIQTFEPGENGLEVPDARLEIWHRIGEYAALFHAVPARGRGEELIDPVRGRFRSPPHPGFDGSWSGYLAYNIASLNDEDELIARGFITPDESRQARRIFEEMRGKNYRFGLIHGDLSLKNTLVRSAEHGGPDKESGGERLHVTLLDWGSAEVAPVPHGDLIQLIQTQARDGTPSEEEFLAFLDGYGLGEDIQAETRELLLLAMFDKLRWAIDCNPGEIEGFARLVREALRLNGVGGGLNGINKE
ncbi:phosphotransferase [Saccharibacillus sp. CPCC 101409]|uniref:phosphotransferase family protein n=1 Tax=Saccharibacillus sp. CPCC 101409 TaxID=3058041 RepID=UPI0026738D49|nr:phosphotransferase [Saccharibacillus sp. CPCC 101409]MDO3412220.1 phosphotransferase [Saccharibacillus sp. CPCC 101409]